MKLVDSSVGCAVVKLTYVVCQVDLLLLVKVLCGPSFRISTRGHKQRKLLFNIFQSVEKLSQQDTARIFDLEEW